MWESENKKIKKMLKTKHNTLPCIYNGGNVNAYIKKFNRAYTDLVYPHFRKYDFLLQWIIHPYLGVLPPNSVYFFYKAKKQKTVAIFPRKLYN